LGGGGFGGRYTLGVLGRLIILGVVVGVVAGGGGALGGVGQPGAKPAGAVVVAGPADTLAGATRLIDELAVAGLETAVLVGLPTPGERVRVGRVGREALGLLSRAEVELAARASVLVATDPAGARRVREVDLGLRLPLLRARAELLVGVAEGDLARLSGAIDALEGIDPLAVGPAALRRVNLALALYHRAVLMGVPAGRESEDLRRAVEMLRWIGEAQVGSDPTTSVPPVLLAEAWFAAVRVITQREGTLAVAQRAGEAEKRPPFAGGSSSADPGMILRHAQVRSAAMAGLWMSAGRAGGFSAVIAPIEVASTPGKLGLSQGQCTAIAEELIGRAAGGVLRAGGTAGELPVGAVVAWGGVLAREPGSRAEAVALLDGALGRADIGDLAPEADVHAALALSQSDDVRDRVRAVARLNRALERGLREPRRGAVLAVLPGLADQGVRGAEGAGDGALVAEANALRLGAFKLAGRGSAGGLRVAEGELRANPQPSAAVLARVLDALSAVEVGSAEAKRAGELGSAAVVSAVGHGRAVLGKFPTAEAAGELARVAQLGIDWHTGRGEVGAAARARVALAEALVASGDKRAVEEYRQLLAVEPPPESPLRMTIGLARAQRASGDVVGAFATYRGVVEMLEEEPSKRAEYFLAWSDMLQILSADNAGGHRSVQIRVRINQLRSLDPQLGVPEAREGIEMVEALVGR